MRFRARHRRWIALVASFCLLFQQVAMAAYWCPNDGGRHAAHVIADAMPPCHGEVSSADARCDRHCAPLPPAPDHPPSPTVPALLPVTPSLASTAGAARVPLARRAAAAIDARSTAPPLTIRHCTFQL